MVIGIIALLIGLIIPALGMARKSARQTVCISNMRTLGAAFGLYAVSNRDSIASFHWQPGQGPYPSQYVDLQANERDPSVAAAKQATDCVRNQTSVPLSLGSWMPNARNSHLLLFAELGEKFLPPVIDCPEDGSRLIWHQALRLNPRMPGPDGGLPETPGRSLYPALGASYWLTPPMYSPDHAVGLHTYNAYSEWGEGFIYGPRAASFQVLGRRKFVEISFPSQKVMMMDQASRHGKKQEFWLYEDVWQPLLFADNSVRVKLTGDANPGCNPLSVDVVGQNSWLAIDAFAYPQWGLNLRGTPAANGNVTDSFPNLRYHSTRNGLRGVDFGANEVFR